LNASNKRKKKKQARMETFMLNRMESGRDPPFLQFDNARSNTIYQLETSLKNHDGLLFRFSETVATISKTEIDNAVQKIVGKKKVNKLPTVELPQSSKVKTFEVTVRLFLSNTDITDTKSIRFVCPADRQIYFAPGSTPFFLFLVSQSPADAKRQKNSKKFSLISSLTRRLFF
jgi:hypothetical protein